MSDGPSQDQPRSARRRAFARAAAWAWLGLVAVWITTNVAVYRREGELPTPSFSLGEDAQYALGDHWEMARKKTVGQEVLTLWRVRTGVGPNTWNSEGGGLGPIPAVVARRSLIDLATRLGPDCVIRQRAGGLPLRLWVSRSSRAASTDAWTTQGGLLWENALLTMLGLLPPAMAVGLLVLGVSAIISRGRRARGVCVNCGYTLAGGGGSDRCPECGRAA